MKQVFDDARKKNYETKFYVPNVYGIEENQFNILYTFAPIFGSSNVMKGIRLWFMKNIYKIPYDEIWRGKKNMIFSN